MRHGDDRTGRQRIGCRRRNDVRERRRFPRRGQSRHTIAAPPPSMKNPSIAMAAVKLPSFPATLTSGTLGFPKIFRNINVHDLRVACADAAPRDGPRRRDTAPIHASARAVNAAKCATRLRRESTTRRTARRSRKKIPDPGLQRRSTQELWPQRNRAAHSSRKWLDRRTRPTSRRRPPFRW